MIPQDERDFALCLADIREFLRDLDDRGVVIGGVAVAILAEPRTTGDVDLTVLCSIDDLPRLMSAAAKHALNPRLLDSEAMARRTRMVLLVHEPTGLQVDVSLGIMPFEVEMVRRARTHVVKDIEVILPTPEDLIIMKAVAHRPKDLIDIESIAQAHPDLDFQRVERWLQDFGRVLETPGLWDQVDRLIRPATLDDKSKHPAIPRQPRRSAKG
jgi:predicted nucleotidyltransferase